MSFIEWLSSLIAKINLSIFVRAFSRRITCLYPLPGYPSNYCTCVFELFLPWRKFWVSSRWIDLLSIGLAVRFIVVHCSGPGYISCPRTRWVSPTQVYGRLLVSKIQNRFVSLLVSARSLNEGLGQSAIVWNTFFIRKQHIWLSKDSMKSSGALPPSWTLSLYLYFKPSYSQVGWDDAWCRDDTDSLLMMRLQRGCFRRESSVYMSEQ